MGETEKAIAGLTKAISIAPDLWPAYLNRGNAYTALQQHDKAVADHGKAVELESPTWRLRISCSAIRSPLPRSTTRPSPLSPAIELTQPLPSPTSTGNAHYNQGDTDGAGWTTLPPLNLHQISGVGLLSRGLVYKKP